MSFSILSRAPLASSAALWLENGLHFTPYPPTTVAIVSASQHRFGQEKRRMAYRQGTAVQGCSMLHMAANDSRRYSVIIPLGHTAAAMLGNSQMSEIRT